MGQSPVERAQDTLGYRFQQSALLDEALTHKSHTNELRQKPRKHNERLEFLGDAVLALLISEHLAWAFPQSTEGDLSKLKARLVSEGSLAEVARRFDLGALLRLGRGEELTRGREKPSLLANALEAIVAAIYLDGGLGVAREFVRRAFLQEFLDLQELGGPAFLHDYKTRVQEWCQRMYDVLPHYTVVKETGPDHQKTFEVQLLIQDEIRGVGIGRSKKEAEQMAAKQALTDGLKE